MDRVKLREMTMQIVFQMDAFNDFDYEHLRVIEEINSAIKHERALRCLNAIRDNIDSIDASIRRNLDNKWNFERIGKTELAILRTAISEMFYCDDIPVNVSINEAVNLSKKFCDEKSYAFVNAVLAKVEKELQ